MVAQGRAIVAAAAARSIPVRLVGGVAIWLRGSAAARAALGRSYPDIDLVAHKRQSRALRSALEEEGFEPERVFNATHGARRLLYHGPGGWQVDIFLDTFEMSHTLTWAPGWKPSLRRWRRPSCCSPSCRSPRSTPRTCRTRRCCCGITSRPTPTVPAG